MYCTSIIICRRVQYILQFNKAYRTAQTIPRLHYSMHIGPGQYPLPGLDGPKMLNRLSKTANSFKNVKQPKHAVGIPVEVINDKNAMLV